jgi:biotin operon repressor
MNRIDRLTAILIQLQTRRVLPAREIAERYGISLRTVYRDIRALEDAGVPVGAEPGKGYFLAEGYHLPPVMFTPDEAGAMLLGAKLIEKFSDSSVNQHFAGALDKIKVVLGETDQDYLNQLDALVTVLSIAPRDREQSPGNMLIAIQTVLADNRVVCIDYHSNSGLSASTSRRPASSWSFWCLTTTTWPAGCCRSSTRLRCWPRQSLKKPLPPTSGNYPPITFNQKLQYCRKRRNFGTKASRMPQVEHLVFYEPTRGLTAWFRRFRQPPNVRPPYHRHSYPTNTLRLSAPVITPFWAACQSWSSTIDFAFKAFRESGCFLMYRR